MTGSITESRRGFLRLVAAASGAGLLPSLAFGAKPPISAWTWRGTALGARASITLYHPDRSEARRIVRACLSEIERLERVFSLYKADSALCTLNRDGVLETPPMELVEVLSLCHTVSERTAGAFDVTVQPLWTLYHEHFQHVGGQQTSGPSDEEVARVRKFVDHHFIDLNASRIRLGKPGMALTLNGIAQGYITDRVARILTAAGLDTALLDLGEIRALGQRRDDPSWRIGVPPEPSIVEQAMLNISHPVAMATSAADGFMFDQSGRHHHLFDPSSGRSLSPHGAVTVLAPSAAWADGLSTAFALMPREHIEDTVQCLADVRVRVLESNGTVVWIG